MTGANYHQRPFRARNHALLSFSLHAAILAVLLFAYCIATLSAFVVLPSDVAVNNNRLIPIAPVREEGIPVLALCMGMSGNAENEELLERARKLREEASLMEDDLKTRTGSSAPAAPADVAVIAVNKKLEESTWTLSYRFSSQPSPKDSDKTDESSKIVPKTFYSGKIDILLKEDGYSERIMAKDNVINKEKDIEIVKIWGWDRETSNEDDLDYLLFSMDVGFPSSDPDLSNQKERYYFQARIEEEAGNLSLKEGTITVKKDVTEKTGGMWGLFNVAGILTEFRYCGDFVARPSR